MVTIKHILIVSTLSVILILASLFFPVRIDNHDQLSDIHLGLPLNFVVQDQTNYDPPYPFTTRLVSPLESKIEVDYLNFIISYLIVGIVLEVIWFVILHLKKRQ